jgi:hypothetical protein
MPLEWPPKNMQKLIDAGLPEDAGQAVAIVKYGKTIANRYWTSHASDAHGFMYMCAAFTSVLLYTCTCCCLSALVNKVADGMQCVQH